MHSVLHQWCFEALEEDMTEMAWLVCVLVASSAPERMFAEHTLIHRRLLPHCDRMRFLFREMTPKVPSNKKMLVARDCLSYCWRVVQRPRQIGRR